MPSLSAYCLTWVSLTLDEGYLLVAAPPDPERGVAPLGPPATVQPPLLGGGAAPLGPICASLGHFVAWFGMMSLSEETLV